MYHPLAMKPIDNQHRLALHQTGATRVLEQNTIAAGETLMAHAGLAVARLALALAPHAQHIWVACGPGNNGGDGLEAARHLLQWGKKVSVTWLGQPDQTPIEALSAWQRACAAGLTPSTCWPTDCDLCIDALLGLGASRAAEGLMAACIAQINQQDAPVLAVDLPSGLNGDTGQCIGPTVQASHTLSLLTLKPGLFMSQGRDAAGQIWFDPLGVQAPPTSAQAWLNSTPTALRRPHASHKGSYGDLAVVGGAPGMTGAALLAAQGALHQGVGRVRVALLDTALPSVGAAQPELMFRSCEQLTPGSITAVIGCGGGQPVANLLPRFLGACPSLVVDADALNAVARDETLRHLLRNRAARGWQTVLTPHPLEAARLLGCTTQAIQEDRLRAAQQLAEQLGCTVVLKGSGTVIAQAGQDPVVNATGNARLATGGTGDVLAGMIGARLAQGQSAWDASCAAVWLHGHWADEWPLTQPLTAGALARTAQP